MKVRKLMIRIQMIQREVLIGLCVSQNISLNEVSLMVRLNATSEFLELNKSI